MGKATCAAFAALSLLAAACGGSDASDSAVGAEPTSVIADAPSATATPLPEPTATPAPTAEPTVAPTDRAVDDKDSGGGPGELSEDEAAVIAAWERYLDLSIEARGMNPSAESLDYESYVVGSTLDAVRLTEKNDAAKDQYIGGVALSLAPRVEFRYPGTAVISDCVGTNLSVIARQDKAVIESFDEVLALRGRLERVGESWFVAAQEMGVETCEI